MTSKVASVAQTLEGTPVAIPDARMPPAAGGIPAEPGLYAWWTTRGLIPEVPKRPHPNERALDLFYVGIAPSGPASSATLRSRVTGNHLSGNTGSSTFRLTLASLLLHELKLHPRNTASWVVLPREENTRLSLWQREHLLLTWCVAQEPWVVEHEVIAQLKPPLNLAGNRAHPFFATLSQARTASRRAAR
jgi:hypothetical protein